MYSFWVNFCFLTYRIFSDIEYLHDNTQRTGGFDFPCSHHLALLTVSIFHLSLFEFHLQNLKAWQMSYPNHSSPFFEIIKTGLHYKELLLEMHFFSKSWHILKQLISKVPVFTQKLTIKDGMKDNVYSPHGGTINIQGPTARHKVASIFLVV